MAIKCLTHEQQLEIIEQFKEEISFSEIALNFNVGVTTIRRVLAEHDVIPPLAFHKTEDEVQMLQVLSFHGITNAEQLREKLKPVSTVVITETAIPETNPKIDVTLFASGGQYFNQIEGWVTIKEVVRAAAKDKWKVVDSKNQHILVDNSGQVENRTYSDYDITDYRKPI